MYIFIGLCVLLATVYYILTNYFKYNFKCLQYLLSSKTIIPITKSKIGVNNFFNIPEHGTIPEQYKIVQSLNVKIVRVLFAWTEGVQPTETSLPNFSFYDDIVKNCPADIKLLVVVAHTPNWFLSSPNNTTRRWFKDWFVKVVDRYKNNPKIIGYEVWNEPDEIVLPSDGVLRLNEPNIYFHLLEMCSIYSKSIDNKKLILNAATFAITQRYPKALEYNKTLKQLGAESLVDKWNIHFYGKQYVDVFKTDGILEFLQSLKVPIWISETGCRNQNNQLLYFQNTYSLLEEHVKNIEYYFWYILTDSDPASSAFGLLAANKSVSPLLTYFIDK